MADLNELQKRLKAFFNQGAKTVGQVSSAVNNITNPVGYAAQRIVQSPQVQQPVRNAFDYTNQRMQQNKPIFDTPVTSRHTIQPQGLKLVRDYAQGQVINPIQEGIKQINQGGIKNQFLGGLSVAGGALSVTPPAMAANTALGFGSSLLHSVRTGQPLTDQAIRQNITQPTSLATEGLGVDNPMLAMPVDMLLSRSPKGIIKDPTGFKGVKDVLTKVGIVPKKNYIDHILEHEKGIDDVIRRYEQARPVTNSLDGTIKMANPEADNILREDAEYIWKEIFGKNNKPPVKLGEIIGELNEAWGGAIQELNQKDNIPYMGMGFAGKNQVKPNVANAGLYDTKYYHGTATPGNEPIRIGGGNLGEGVYLTKDIGHARDYAAGWRGGVDPSDYDEVTPQHIKQVQILAKKIFRTDKDAQELDEAFINNLKKQGYEGLETPGETIVFNPKHIKTIGHPSAEEFAQTNPVTYGSRVAQPPLSEIPKYIQDKIRSTGLASLNPEEKFLVDKKAKELLERGVDQAPLGIGNIDVNNLDVGNGTIGENNFTEGQLQGMIHKDVPVSPLPPQGNSKSGSVLDDIVEGFSSGRLAREASEKQADGSVGQRARSQLLDDLSPVFDMVNMGGKAAPGEADAYEKMRLLRGVTGKVDVFLQEKLAPILKRVGDKRSALSQLLVLERERELIEKHGLTRTRNIAQIDQGIQELRAQYGGEGLAQLQAEAQEVRRVGGELLEMLRGSVIDEDTYKAIVKNNEFYAPFEAVSHMADNIARGDFGNGSYNVASQDVVKKIGNYEGQVADPLETLARKIPKVIALVEKNKTLQSFVDLRNKNPEIYKDLIVPVKDSDVVPEGMGVINVFENGQNVKYAVPDVVARAIKHLDAESANVLVDIGKAQAKLLRAGTVVFNIGFIPVNVIRDVQDASTTVLTEKGLKGFVSFLSQYPRALFQAAGKTARYKEWVASGGAGGTLTEQVFKDTPETIGELAGDKPKLISRLNPIKGAGDLLQFLGRVGEQTTRLARYNAGVDSFGESAQKAAFASRDVSLDFAKSGNAVKTLNRVVPFLNAGIQGSEKLVRLYKDNPKAAVAATGIMYGLPTVLLYQHNTQFADYDDIPDSEKQENWIILSRDRTPEEIAAGDGPIGIKIAKGFIGRPVANTVESAMSFMEKPDPATLGNTALDTIEGISPVGLPVTPDRIGRTLSAVTPPIMKAGIEWTTNTNLHTGLKIVPQSLQDLPDKEQYKETTPNIYKIAGQVTGQSPLKIENTVNTTTGGLGRQIAALASNPTDVNSYTLDQVTRRFTNIKDGKKANEAYALVDEEKAYTAQRNRDLKKAAMAGNWQEVERLAVGMSPQQIKSLITNEYKKEEKKNLTPVQRAYQGLSQEEQRRVLFERPELKSEIELMPEAEAAGNDLEPMKYQSSIKDSIAESTAKSRVQFSGKPEEVNGTYYYINKNGNVAGIKTDHDVPLPEMTGDEVLDKEIRKDFYSDINSKKQDIIDLVKLKYYTPEKAKAELDKLEALRTGVAGGSGKKRGVRDVARMKISAPTVKFTALKRRALPTVRLKGAANKTISIQKVGPSKSVKIIAPKASHSYKIVRPKLTGLQTGIKIV